MRVVAGSARGKPLLVVPGHSTRPILDRVKTALFDVLRPRIEGLTVLDLFAGSGGVGIEALSQGAASCVFLDLEAKAVATIKKNLASTGLGDRARVRLIDALKFLKTTEEAFDLIYVAPPQYKKLWVQAMTLIAGRPGVLRSDDESSGLVIVQIDPREYEPLSLGHLREIRQKRYGNSLLVFYETSTEALPIEGEEESTRLGSALDGGVVGIAPIGPAEIVVAGSMSESLEDEGIDRGSATSLAMGDHRGFGSDFGGGELRPQ